MLYTNHPLPKVVHVSTFFNIYLIQIKEKKEDGRSILRAMDRIELNPAGRRSSKLRAHNAGLHVRFDSNISNGYQLFATK